MNGRWLVVWGAFVCATAARASAGASRPPLAVDFRFAPPEWQAAICLPDDPQKTLVDHGGALLYHYGKGGRDFATRLSVEVASNAVWKAQGLLSPRVPVVRTLRAAEGLEIVEEAFAVTGLKQPARAAARLSRLDDGGELRGWAQPGGDADRDLCDICVHMNGALQFKAAGPSYRVALALCEGWWSEPGKRVLTLRVEGAPPRTVDTVADIGKNRAAVFWFDGRDESGDGMIDIRVESDDRAADRNTILNGLWLFPEGARFDDAAVLSGAANAEALARMRTAASGGPARNDVILVSVRNAGAEPRTVRPRLVVQSTLGCRLDGGRVYIGGHEAVSSSLKMGGEAAADKSRLDVALEAVTVPAGGSAQFSVMLSAGGELVFSPATAAEARAALEQAVAYWRQAPLPYGRVEVPDADIQALIDSSIRNIWQAREIKDGMAAFQVGPTCYRGLWIVDGAFLLEAATLLGAGREARSGVAYELSHQRDDGRIQVMKDFSKENGIVLWTCFRHAQLMQDRAWLESVWPRLRRVAEHVRALRRETLKNASPLDDGLVPAGFSDGGIGGIHDEYTNPYWNLLGLRAYAAAAQWLGKAGEAAEWRGEYEEFLSRFREAAARDLQKDPHGNPHLPTLMGEAGRKELPQRGQWAFCHAVYPGQIFAREDPLVAGNLAMLKATEREEMVYGTGWDATGIWNYFASFYGHAWLWQGDGQKAARALYAFANHAAPVLDWREEQSLKGEPFKKVGDMPHNWASAEFIRLAVHLLAIDRGDELHLLEGLPPEWTRPGMVTRLNGICTPFGPLTMSLHLATDGKTAVLNVAPLGDASCSRVVVHLGGWAPRDGRDVMALNPKEAHHLTLEKRVN